MKLWLCASQQLFFFFLSNHLSKVPFSNHFLQLILHKLWKSYQILMGDFCCCIFDLNLWVECTASVLKENSKYSKWSKELTGFSNIASKYLLDGADSYFVVKRAFLCYFLQTCFDLNKASNWWLCDQLVPSNSRQELLLKPDKLLLTTPWIWGERNTNCPMQMVRELSDSQYVGSELYRVSV